MLATVAAALLLVAVIRYVSWWCGVGELSEDRRQRDPDRFAFTARLGYAFLPATLGTSLALIGVVIINVGGLRGSLALEFAGACVAGLFVPFAAWGWKEYRRPSAWLPRPAWLEEFERTNGRWEGGIPWRKW